MKKGKPSDIATASFYFSHVRLSPHEQIGLHSQSSWELSCVVMGNGRRRIGDRWGPFVSGDVVLVPPQVPHCWQFDESATYDDGCIENVTISFQPEFLTHLQECFAELRETVEHLAGRRDAVFVQGEAADKVRRIMLDMVGQSAQERMPALISLLVFLTSHIDSADMTAVTAFAAKLTKRIHDVETYVACNCQRDISIDTVARHVGMNRSAFCTFFRKSMGTTFVSYLNLYRIEMACEMLRSSEASVAEICYRSGFRDVPYFNRVFKRLKGMSPKEFRQQE